VRGAALRAGARLLAVVAVVATVAQEVAVEATTTTTTTASATSTASAPSTTTASATTTRLLQALHHRRLTQVTSEDLRGEEGLMGWAVLHGGEEREILCLVPLHQPTQTRTQDVTREGVLYAIPSSMRASKTMPSWIAS